MPKKNAEINTNLSAIIETNARPAVQDLVDALTDKRVLDALKMALRDAIIEIVDDRLNEKLKPVMDNVLKISVDLVNTQKFALPGSMPSTGRT